MSIGDWVGLIGGVTGAGSAFVTFLAYRRDQALVRIRLARDQIVTSGKDGDDARRALIALMKQSGEPPTPELFYTDPDKTWMSIEIANIGRRPIKIQKIGFVIDAPTKPYHVVADFKPRVLDESQNISQQVDQDSEDPEAILAVFLNDAAGRNRYGAFARGPRGWLCRLKAFLGLRPFVR
jgi:hypothetical protein